MFPLGKALYAPRLFILKGFFGVFLLPLTPIKQSSDTRFHDSAVDFPLIVRFDLFSSGQIYELHIVMLLSLDYYTLN